VPSVVPRCPDWCHSVFLVLSQFSPFCTPGTRGQGHGHGPKPRPINAKKPRVSSGFRGKTMHFEAFCRSGETEFEPRVPVRALRFSRLVQLHKNRCVVRDDYLKNSLCGGYFRCVPTQPAYLKASRGPHGGLVQLDSSGA
jgi:hypothetical protein